MVGIGTLLATGVAFVWVQRTTLLPLVRRRFRAARWPAAVAVASVVSVWGVAHYPWLLVEEVTILDAAGASATLRGLLVAVGRAVVVWSRRWRTSCA